MPERVLRLPPDILRARAEARRLLRSPFRRRLTRAVAGDERRSDEEEKNSECCHACSVAATRAPGKPRASRAQGAATFLSPSPFAAEQPILRQWGSGRAQYCPRAIQINVQPFAQRRKCGADNLSARFVRDARLTLTPLAPHHPATCAHPASRQDCRLHTALLARLITSQNRRLHFNLKCFGASRVGFYGDRNVAAPCITAPASASCSRLRKSASARSASVSVSLSAYPWASSLRQQPRSRQTPAARAARRRAIFQSHRR